MRITTKVLKVLALLANTGPKYGAQLVEMSPTAFSDVKRVGARGIPATNVYVLLNRMADEKLIELLANFKPDIPNQGNRVASRKWYKITAAGRKVLQDARASLEV